MGTTTEIAWTDHTLNPWIGCAKVSPGCAHCYAEHAPPTRVHRAKGLELWGTGAERHETRGWLASIRRWDDAAFRSGVRKRVFVASLADVFEDHPALPSIRWMLFAHMERARGLDFQVLTKRPQNILRMVPPSWKVTGAPPGSKLGWPAHVWIGTTAEDQDRADERIPHLLGVPARVRFLSVEPMLGPIDFRKVHGFNRIGLGGIGARAVSQRRRPLEVPPVRVERHEAAFAHLPAVTQDGARAVLLHEE